MHWPPKSVQATWTLIIAASGYIYYFYWGSRPEWAGGHTFKEVWLPVKTHICRGPSSECCWSPIIILLFLFFPRANASVAPSPFPLLFVSIPHRRLVQTSQRTIGQGTEQMEIRQPAEITDGYPSHPPFSTTTTFFTYSLQPLPLCFCLLQSSSTTKPPLRLQSLQCRGYVRCSATLPMEQ